MINRWREKLDFTKGLGFRLATLLSVAILPIGLISVVQTLSLSQEAERSAEIALLGRTASAAAGERALLQSALGTADAMGPAVLNVIDDPIACGDMMRGFIQRSASYVYAGFVPMSGLTACNSSDTLGEVVDMRVSSAYQKFIAQPGTLMTALSRGLVSNRAVVLVMHPVYRDREVLGYVGLSLSQDLLQSTHSQSFDTDGARIITFNHLGEVLTTDNDIDASDDSFLPQGTTLSDMLARTDTTFRATSNAGEERVFTVSQVVPGLVYALGSWSPQTAGIGGIKMSRFAAMAIPVALWVVSLVVAYFAVYRLVLRHIRELRGQMRRFAIGNRDEPPPVLTDAPAEIADVSQTFHNMARILIRDEDAMEKSVLEKSVLLKEVHHRVKNNLQLIASIINMQGRMIEDDDAKRVLRSVQDRVAALATIYRNLYQAEHLNQVEADRLIGDIINHMSNMTLVPDSNLRIETHFDPLILLPDQAVPLSLLATEAFTNALKYAGKPPNADQPWVRVSLTVPTRGEASLEIENSTGERQIQHDGTGLGSQLIDAFATQLNGHAEQGAQEHRFFLRLAFRVEEATESDADDLRNVFLTSAAREGARH